MPSCCKSNTPSSGEKDQIERKSESCCNKQEQSGALSKLPVLSALLSSSCCWLPTVLDFLSVGSASATSFQRFRPLFLLITIAVLSWDVYKRGLTRRTALRIAIPAFLLAWPHFHELYTVHLGDAVASEPVVHKCH